MATTFQSVNAILPPRNLQAEALTPTTPRAPMNTSPPSHSAPLAEDSAPPTPTRHSFGGVSGQRPLPGSLFESPTSPKQQSVLRPHPGLSREGSLQSVPSCGSQDIDMDESDPGEEDSDGESIDEQGRPFKKKKGQKFFCTEFPPCSLSFTRSEHLARHIRFEPSNVPRESCPKTTDRT